jgi:serine/threonine protein kinase
VERCGRWRRLFTWGGAEDCSRRPKTRMFAMSLERMLIIDKGNILIDNEGIPKICDFGLARIFLEEESVTMTTTEHTGTERYLAPELVAGEEDTYPTIASDVYALGCLGLEVIPTVMPADTLLQRLWAADPIARPSAPESATILETMSPI